MNPTLKLFSLFLICFTLNATAMVAAKKCTRIFTVPKATPELKTSVADSIRALAEFRISLDTGKTEGKSSIDRTALEKNYAEKENELLQYLQEKNLMDRASLLAEIKKTILKIQSAKEAEKDSEKKNAETQRARTEQALRDLTVDGTRAIFYKIKPGTFQMNSGSLWAEMADHHKQPRVKVTLTKPFEMMATLTTQVIWQKVAEMDDKRPTIEARPSYAWGDIFPVESVSLIQVRQWIGVLNRLSKKGHPALAELIAGHQQGDIYRLPTEAEWEFVILRSSRLKEKNPEQPGDEFRSEDTYPVASNKPFKVDGKYFYDMIGAMHEYVEDSFSPVLEGGINPVMKRKNNRTGVSRGSISSPNTDDIATWFKRNKFPTNSSAVYQSFRLVREVRP